MSSSFAPGATGSGRLEENSQEQERNIDRVRTVIIRLITKPERG